mmetsp:Transcript_60506/g.148447  ORF Transcript_60506/g.148447 Transcript_60506/m.148447 type:complete len:223 (+) Transcript_60506:103-771(+)
MMHPSTILLVLLVVSVSTLTPPSAVVNAFVGPTTSTRSVSSSSLLRAAPELEPEPEGGDELTAIKTLAGSRMKKMSPVDNIKSEDGSPVSEFWLSAKVEGSAVQSIHSEVLKESAKKANFPGFRKGQVPPFAMPQIRGFAVSEAIVRTCQAAVDAYGLKSLKGSDGEVNVNEDIEELSKTYKVGDDIFFTATFKASMDEEVSVDSVSDAIDAVADVVDVVEE